MHLTFSVRKILAGTRDTVAWKLWEDGVGAFTKETEVISIEDEQIIWQKDVMGTHSPKVLLYAVFFAKGKTCSCVVAENITCWRSHSWLGKEDKAGEVLEYVTYKEHGLKNRSGSYKDKRDNKVITHYFYCEPTSADFRNVCSKMTNFTGRRNRRLPWVMIHLGLLLHHVAVTVWVVYLCCGKNSSQDEPYPQSHWDISNVCCKCTWKNNPTAEWP